MQDVTLKHAFITILAGTFLLSAPPAAAQTWEQAAKLLANEGSEFDQFGESVAISGDTALVGAPRDEGAGELSGSVYVFVRDGLGNWTQQARLLANDAALGNGFGLSVALSGDTALIGAITDAPQGSGSAYVFVRTGTSWVQQAKLLANDAAEGSFLGFSVAISGDTAVVGAIFADDSGAAYVFVRDDTSWSQQAKLLGDAANDNFGRSVAVSGDTAVIGEHSLFGESGAAYVFVRNGTSWDRQAKLVIGDDAAVDRLTSVAISGDSVLVGSLPAGGSDDVLGAAYVFVRNATTWSQQATLLASDGAPNDRFGSSVALSGDMALIGAEQDDDLGGDSGSAYVFVRTGTSWVQQDKILADDGAAQDLFGIRVALTDGTAVIGSFLDDDLGTDSGSAYVFSFEPLIRKAPVAIFFLVGEDEE